MTIDEVIRELEKARALMPSGGKADVIMPDGRLVQQVLAGEGLDSGMVVITDMDKDGKTG